ncbi:hypothetical protein Fmac_002083 [Flemingia macrophylla]
MEAARSFAQEDVNYQCQQQQQDQNVMIANIEEVEVPMQMQQEEIYVDDEVQELHDLLISIANQPLMSPPPCARDGSNWNDVDIFDAEVSLWNFSI